MAVASLFALQVLAASFEICYLYFIGIEGNLHVSFSIHRLMLFLEG